MWLTVFKLLLGYRADWDKWGIKWKLVISRIKIIFATKWSKLDLINERPVPNKRPGFPKGEKRINDHTLITATSWSNHEKNQLRPVVAYSGGNSMEFFSKNIFKRTLGSFNSCLLKELVYLLWLFLDDIAAKNGFWWPRKKSELSKGLFKQRDFF